MTVRMPARERTAVLVLRVLITEGEGWRARVVTSEDVLSGDQRSVACGDVDEICRLVRGWLEPLAVQAGDALPRRLTSR